MEAVNHKRSANPNPSHKYDSCQTWDVTYQDQGKNNQYSNKIRPLNVILNDESFKNQMMKNAKKLRRNAKFNNVFLKNDLTRKQQQLEFDLRQEKKQRTLNGEDVIIFDNKVIPRCQHPNFEPSKQKHVSDKAQNTTESA